MIGKARIVEDDLFSVVSRLKSIDSSYFVVENYKLKRLELHSTCQRGNTLTLVLPHRVLDERTIRFVMRTRVERSKKLFEELEQANKEYEKKRIDSIVKKCEKEVENEYRNL